ncbi:MAG: Smr/MutS family protein [Alphaproteobacteria bacterium]|nr:Smr/MutS family protein [Alphaproteobacteria bacterium]
MSRPPKPPLPPEDDALWREETARDTPLSGREIVPPPAPVAPPVAPAPAAVSSLPMLPSAPPAAYLDHGALPGLDRKRRAKLREDAPDGRLDLHGMTQDAAHAALDEFIRAMYARGKRQLLVITGKGPGGDGVLKRAVPQWLNGPELRPMLLGFDYAPAKLGGEGALSVLLRKNKVT